MCGICGILNSSSESVDRGLLSRMTEVMTHRGPDGSGQVVMGRIGLGHRRLSIIDIEGGTQPMFSMDNNLALVFNGEIYNFIELREELQKAGHLFSTRSDTEVILHAYEEWGKECVNRFNGIFAFALWDKKREILFLARDHLGVKPLYYFAMNGTFLFASEIKSLLEYDKYERRVDLESLDRLFTFRYVPSPDTLFKDIHKIPPGNYMTVSSGGLKIHRYWTWTPKLKSGYDVSELVSEYRDLLQDAIRLQLRSDVPVGLFLSSGIDSGAILSVMRRYSSGPLYTFTIGFEDGSRTNETDDAREMAKRFDTIHDEMIIGHKEYEDYYDRYLWDLEEPVGNETAVAFYYVSKLARDKVKVVLTGQGADEPWGGYHRYIGVKLSKYYAKMPHFLTDRLAKNIVMKLPRNERLKRGVLSLSERDTLTRFTKIYSFFSAEMKAKLFSNWLQSEIGGDSYGARGALAELFRDVEGLDNVTQMLYIDTRANLPDDLLMVSDKTSMANSIEARVPFLDYRLVEFIETLPPNLKLKGFQGKYLHKKALEGWLPRHVIYRKKKGFENPVDKWLRSKMSGFLKNCLLSEESGVKKYFNAEYIRQLVALHESGVEDYMRHINLLIAFELWHRKFMVN